MNPYPITNPVTRKGKIARLPYLERDMVNRMLRNNISYPKIAEALGHHGFTVTDRNVSNWKTRGGYRDWCAEQDRAVETRLFQDNLLEHLRTTDASNVAEVGLQLAATNLSHYFLQPEIRQQMITDPEKQVRSVGALCRLASQIRSHQKDRDQAAKELGPRHHPEFVRREAEDDIERTRNIFSAQSVGERAGDPIIPHRNYAPRTRRPKSAPIPQIHMGGSRCQSAQISSGPSLPGSSRGDGTQIPSENPVSVSSVPIPQGSQKVVPIHRDCREQIPCTPKGVAETFDPTPGSSGLVAPKPGEGGGTDTLTSPVPGSATIQDSTVGVSTTVRPTEHLPSVPNSAHAPTIENQNSKIETPFDPDVPGLPGVPHSIFYELVSMIKHWGSHPGLNQAQYEAIARREILKSHQGVARSKTGSHEGNQADSTSPDPNVPGLPDIPYSIFNETVMLIMNSNRYPGLTLADYERIARREILDTIKEAQAEAKGSDSRAATSVHSTIGSIPIPEGSQKVAGVSESSKTPGYREQIHCTPKGVPETLHATPSSSGGNDAPIKSDSLSAISVLSATSCKTSNSGPSSFPSVQNSELEALPPVTPTLASLGIKPATFEAKVLEITRDKSDIIGYDRRAAARAAHKAFEEQLRLEAVERGTPLPFDVILALKVEAGMDPAYAHTITGRNVQTDQAQLEKRQRRQASQAAAYRKAA